MAKDQLHVVPHDDTWAVKRAGNERASSTHATQKEAIDAARGLAKDGDEIVIHRPDGTIREQVTYTAPAAATNGTTASPSSALRPSDLTSVGSRVNWGAVIAGVIVALAVYVTLNLLAFAIGITTIDQMGRKTFAIGATIVSTFCLMVSLFLGGFVASKSTVGEQKTEAMTYGVLVWGTILMLLLVTGFGLGIGHFAGARDLGRMDVTAPPVVNVEAAKQEATQTGAVSPQALAWWTFGGVVLAMACSVGGALVGAGPEMVIKRFRGNRVAVAVPTK